MQRKLRLRTAWRVGAGLAVAALVLAACGSSSSNGTTSSTSAAGYTTTTVPKTIQHGGTAYFALAPQVTPDWIFPFASLQYFSVANLTQFQYLMYRPLYWFGPPTSTSPDVDFALSTRERPGVVQRQQDDHDHDEGLEVRRTARPSTPRASSSG